MALIHIPCVSQTRERTSRKLTNDFSSCLKILETLKFTLREAFKTKTGNSLVFTKRLHLIRFGKKENIYHSTYDKAKILETKVKYFDDAQIF